ncbi:MAG TPA: 2-hydroxymuconate tautomerase [Candidatus Angelobacter sp.]
MVIPEGGRRTAAPFHFCIYNLRRNRRSHSMPLIQVTMLKGRSVDQKRKIAERITQAMVEDGKAAKEAVVVTFIEITREDYANAGVLLVDKK